MAGQNRAPVESRASWTVPVVIRQKSRRNQHRVALAHRVAERRHPSRQSPQARRGTTQSRGGAGRGQVAGRGSGSSDTKRLGADPGTEYQRCCANGDTAQAGSAAQPWPSPRRMPQPPHALGRSFSQRSDPIGLDYHACTCYLDCPRCTKIPLQRGTYAYIRSRFPERRLSIHSGLCLMPTDRHGLDWTGHPGGDRH